MKGITIRKDGRYMGRLTINHKQVCVYGKTIEEVKAKLEEKQKQKKVIEEEFNYDTMSLGTFAKEFLNTFKAPIIKGSTYNVLKNKYSKWYDTKLFKKRIKNITHIDIREFFEKENTNYSFYLDLKEIFSKLLEIGIIKLNPMALVVKPKKESLEDRTKILDGEDDPLISDADFNRLLSYTKEIEYEKLFYLLINTGLRIGEALALYPEDFDWDSKRIRVYKTYYTPTNDIQTTKTSKGTRYVPIFNVVEDQLKLFVSSKQLGKRIFRFDTTKLNNFYVSLKNKYGLKIKSHMFRKTFISRCQFKFGVAQNVIAQWVGHESTSTTQDYYTFLSSAENVKAIDTINDTSKLIDVQFSS